MVEENLRCLYQSNESSRDVFDLHSREMRDDSCIIGYTPLAIQPHSVLHEANHGVLLLIRNRDFFRDYLSLTILSRNELPSN